MLKLLSKKTIYLLFVSFALFISFCNARAATKDITLIIQNTSISPIDLRYEIYRKYQDGKKYYYTAEDVNQLNPNATYSTTIHNAGAGYTQIAEITKVSAGNKTVAKPKCSKTFDNSNHLQIQVTFAEANTPTVTCHYIS